MELFIILLIAVAVFVLSGIKVIKQYERGVVLTLGRFTGIRDPGLRIVVPVFQTLTRVDIRSTPIDVSKQEVITRDNVTVSVDAVVYLRAVKPDRAVLEITNYIYGTSQFAQAALRDVIGNADLDDVLTKRDEMSMHIKEIVDKQTDQWGIDVEAVKIQNIELGQDMKRAMAKQAEAERERRAVIITAEGEKAAAQAVADAAKLLSNTPGGISVRTLQSLEKISMEPSQKTVVLLPSELTSFKDILTK
ncbi:slipin family protein [Candidatus Saccharibacteria bacterium]|nr:slipin family protein [Candidatus Saccharibacteria bacterium]